MLWWQPEAPLLFIKIDMGRIWTRAMEVEIGKENFEGGDRGEREELLERARVADARLDTRMQSRTPRPLHRFDHRDKISSCFRNR
jgi:hypothetical protein